MKLPTPFDEQSSKTHQGRGLRAARSAVLISLATAAVVAAALPVLGGEPPPGATGSSVSVEGGAVNGSSAPTAAQVKWIGPAGTAEIPGTQKTKPLGKPFRFVPPPPGFVVGGDHGSGFMKDLETTDPPFIESITKFWDNAKQSWRVTISWINGQEPYSVVASTTPSFEWEVETLAKGISATSLVHYIAGDIVDNLFFLM